MQEGYIKLHRCILDSSWSRNPAYVALWTYCLLRANYNPADIITKEGIKVHLEPGQFITSREQISVNTGIEQSKVERILKAFKSEQQIEQQNRGKFRIISILNWNKYQSREQENEQHVNNRRTTDEQHVNTNKKVKKEKKDKKENLSASDDAAQPIDDSILTRKNRSLTGKRLASFNLFWDAFDYKRGRAEAADSWLDIPNMTGAIVCKIVEAAKMEAGNRPDLVKRGSTPKMAQGWLTARRWEDEVSPSADAVLTEKDPGDKQLGYYRSLGYDIP